MVSLVNGVAELVINLYEKEKIIFIHFNPHYLLSKQNYELILMEKNIFVGVWYGSGLNSLNISDYLIYNTFLKLPLLYNCQI